MNIFLIVTDCFPIVQSTWHFYLNKSLFIAELEGYIIDIKRVCFRSLSFFHMSRFYYIRNILVQMNPAKKCQTSILLFFLFFFDNSIPNFFYCMDQKLFWLEKKNLQILNWLIDPVYCSLNCIPKWRLAQ